MKNRAISFCLLLLLTCFIAACHSNSQYAPAPDVKYEVQTTFTENVAMFNLIRQALRLYPDMEKVLKIPEDPGLPKLCNIPIFITIFHEASPPIIGWGTHGCTHEAILRAVVMLVRNPDFSKHYLINLQKTSIAVDIMLSRSRMDLSKGLQQIHFESGIYGLAIQTDKQMIYQIPEEYVYFGWEDNITGKIIRQKRLKMQLEYLSERADLGSSGWKDHPVYRFRTFSFLQHRPDFAPIMIYRGMPRVFRYNSAQVAEASVNCGTNLIEHIQPTGRFLYEYDPLHHKKSGILKYNIVNHTGCVYALARLYNASKERLFIEKGLPPIEFILRNFGPPLLEPDLLSVRKHQVAELGSSALFLLALCELPDELFERLQPNRINRLAQYIVEMQQENGFFYNQYWEKLFDHQFMEPYPVYQGQALLSLIRYFRRNPNQEWLEASKKAADAQIAQFERTGNPESWTIQGLAELYELDKEPKLANAVFKMADTILQHQYLSEKVPYLDYFGGFDNIRPPRTISVATRTEALVAAWRLAHTLGVDSEKYENAILASASFLLLNQYRKDNTYFCAVPKDAQGGFRGGLIDPIIRIDYNEYAILALTSAFDVVYSKEHNGKLPLEEKGASPSDIFKYIFGEDDQNPDSGGQ